MHRVTILGELPRVSAISHWRKGRRHPVGLLGITFAVVFALAASVDMAFAQSGHFIEKGAGAPVCLDGGTTVTCTGKVTGLGGTTFEITIEATGIASVE